MEGNTLDDILNDAPTPEVEAPQPEPQTEAEPVVEAEEPKPEGPQRDEKGRFAAKSGEEEATSPVAEDEPKLDHKALLGERRRRQEAEDRYKALEERMRALEAPKPAQQQPWQQAQQQPASNGFEFDENLYWGNPGQFLNNFADHIRQNLMSEMQGVIPQMVSVASYDRAEQAAKARYEDYDDAFAAFRDAAAVNPSLRESLTTQPDPAEFAYQEGKRLLAMASFGSTEAYIEAEIAKRLAAQQPKPSIPTSLADAPASRAPAGGVPMAPPSLDDILKG